MKTILILSTEPWGKMFLSKMHYALALAEEGNQVFFVNPPRKAANRFQVDKPHKNITILQPDPIRGRRFLMTKAFWLYKPLSSYYANKIRRRISASIDEVWCFNPHVYMDLKRFGAKKTMLLLYDFYKGEHIFKVAATADLLVSVSQVILDYYADTKPPKVLMQHGLGDDFVRIAESRENGVQNNQEDKQNIHFGYVGNLLRAAIDFKAAVEIITDHPEVIFHFWGPFDFRNNNVSSQEVGMDNQAFINFLKKQSNVLLHGVKTQEQLAKEMQDMDGFLFLYDSKKDMNGASNSHKLIEYLSFGKVVVSTYVSNYKDTDLLTMDKSGKDTVTTIFDRVISNLSHYNHPGKQKERIGFALQNSYTNQLKKIRDSLSLELTHN